MVTPSQEPSQVALPSTCGVRCHDAAPYLVPAPTGAEAKGPRLKHQLSSCCQRHWTRDLERPRLWPHPPGSSHKATKSSKRLGKIKDPRS